MLIATFKALHLIGMVTWFAGLFYLVRLFVYHAETRDMPEEKGKILAATPQLNGQTLEPMLAEILDGDGAK